MSDADAMHLRFAQYVLDLERRELRSESEVIHVERQVFDLLTFLLENADRVVSKDEIMDAIWKGQIVSESALTSRIRSARMAIGDDGRAQLFIKTIHGVGYRFVGDVSVELSGAERAGTADRDAGRPVDRSFATREQAASSSEPEGASLDSSSRSRIDSPRVSARRRWPRPAKPLIGREGDCAAILERAASRRLITVVGPGGIGKTHLLQHLGAARISDYEDGGVFVGLAEIRQDDAVAPAILDALGVRAEPGETAADAIVGFLEQVEMLVLIDNAEQVRAAVADLAERILANCPRTTLFVTSRQRLNVPGEAIHALLPLEASAARTLFVEHARAHGVDLDANRGDVVAVCEQLDGVPLALELASSRTRLLSVSDVSARLGHHLSDASTTVDSEGRHRSVEAALAWSFDALAPEDRRLLQDLTVLAGGFDVAAANAIGRVEDATAALLRLADQSLLVAIPSSESSRFRLLEPVRLFATEEGEENAAALDRHLAYFLSEAEAARTEVNSDDVDDGVGRFHLCWPNLRAAFFHAEATKNLPSMVRLVVSLAEYAELRLRTEVSDWARRTRQAAAGTDVDEETRTAELISLEVRLALHSGDRARAEALAPRLEAAEPTLQIVIARAWLAWFRGRSEEVDALLVELLAAARSGAETGFRQLAIYNFDIVAQAIRGRTGEESALATLALGTPSETHRAFSALAEAFLALWSGDRERAVDTFDLASDRFDRLGYAFLALTAASYRSSVLVQLDDQERTLRCIQKALRVGIQVRRTGWLSFDVALATRTLVGWERDAIATRLMAAVDRSPMEFPDTRKMVGRYRSRLEERLGDGFEQEYRAGVALSILEAARLALDALEAGPPDTRGAT